jgi:hypothetical protein
VQTKLSVAVSADPTSKRQKISETAYEERPAVPQTTYRRQRSLRETAAQLHPTFQRNKQTKASYIEQGHEALFGELKKTEGASVRRTMISDLSDISPKMPSYTGSSGEDLGSETVRKHSKAAMRGGNWSTYNHDNFVIMRNRFMNSFHASRPEVTVDFTRAETPSPKKEKPSTVYLSPSDHQAPRQEALLTHKTPERLTATGPEVQYVASSNTPGLFGASTSQPGLFGAVPQASTPQTSLFGAPKAESHLVPSKPAMQLAPSGLTVHQPPQTQQSFFKSKEPGELTVPKTTAPSPGGTASLLQQKPQSVPSQQPSGLFSGTTAAKEAPAPTSFFAAVGSTQAPSSTSLFSGQPVSTAPAFQVKSLVKPEAALASQFSGASSHQAIPGSLFGSKPTTSAAPVHTSTQPNFLMQKGAPAIPQPTAAVANPILRSFPNSLASQESSQPGQTSFQATSILPSQAGKSTLSTNPLLARPSGPTSSMPSTQSIPSVQSQPIQSSMMNPQPSFGISSATFQGATPGFSGFSTSSGSAAVFQAKTQFSAMQSPLFKQLG